MKKRLCMFFLMVQVIFFFFIVYIKVFLKSNPSSSCIHFNSERLYYKSLLEHEKKLHKILAKYNPILIKESYNEWIQLVKDVFVYSAYIDDCPPFGSLCIKLVAITVRQGFKSDKTSKDLRCAFKNEDYEFVSEANFVILSELLESHELKFTTTLLYCSLSNVKENNLPKYVSLFANSKFNLTWIPITSLKKPLAMSNYTRLTVCTRPFFGSILNFQIGEFIAYYSMMGVTHFTFYDTSKTSLRGVFFQIVKQFNVSIELLQWQLPLNNSVIHQYAQVAFTHDCILRNQKSSTHVAIIDLDEFIVPKKHANLKQFVSYLDNTYSNIGSYVIASAYFCEEYISHNNSLSPFRLFEQNKRQKTVWEHWYRSKLIVKPNHVEHIGIHRVFRHRNKMKELCISPSLALLHHYSRCCGNSQDYFLHLLTFRVLEDDVVLDESLHIFQKNFSQNIIIKFLQNSLQFKISEVNV